MSISGQYGHGRPGSVTLFYVANSGWADPNKLQHALDEAIAKSNADTEALTSALAGALKILDDYWAASSAAASEVMESSSTPADLEWWELEMEQLASIRDLTESALTQIAKFTYKNFEPSQRRIAKAARVSPTTIRKWIEDPQPDP